MTSDQQRWEALARVIADGVRVGAGDRVSITLTAVEGFPTAEALVAEVYRRGAEPQVLLVDERFERHALRQAPMEVLQRTPEMEAEAMRWSDIHIALRGMLVPDPSIEDVEDARLAALRGTKGRISTLRWEDTRWCIVRVPTPEWATLLGIPTERLVDEFLAGCLVDWEARRADWTELASRWNDAATARIVSGDTDLRLDITDRRWIVFAGEANLPDGELATAPHEAGVEGRIVFDDPFSFGGRRFADLALTFEEGAVTHVEASEGLGVAQQILATDEGAVRVGELGVGVNPTMSLMTGDLFFDEKLRGTVHIALGRAYPECGGQNRSAIHWDIVKDLRPRDGRPGGSFWLDDVAIIEDGVPRW